MADQELKDLADAALATARKAGASYADIRINRYRNQFIFTRDREVQNIVNTEDFGFGVRVHRRRHLGLRQQQRGHARTKSPRSRGRRLDIARANRSVNTDPVQLAPVEAYASTPRGTRRSRRIRSSCRCSRRSICCCRSTRRR